MVLVSSIDLICWHSSLFINQRTFLWLFSCVMIVHHIIDSLGNSLIKFFILLVCQSLCRLIALNIACFQVQDNTNGKESFSQMTVSISLHFIDIFRVKSLSNKYANLYSTFSIGFIINILAIIQLKKPVHFNIYTLEFICYCFGKCGFSLARCA